MCLPTVVAEFSRLVARLGLMDCGALLPQRSQAMRAQRPLEMFFPFDPYLLRRSAQVCRLIWPLLLPTMHLILEPHSHQAAKTCSIQESLLIKHTVILEQKR